METSRTDFDDLSRCFGIDWVAIAASEAINDQPLERETVGGAMWATERFTEDRDRRSSEVLGRWSGELVHPGFGSFPLSIVVDTLNFATADGRYGIDRLSSPLYGGILPKSGELRYAHYPAFALVRLQLAPVGFFDDFARTGAQIVELEGCFSDDAEMLSGAVMIRVLGFNETIPYGTFRLVRT